MIFSDAASIERGKGGSQRARLYAERILLQRMPDDNDDACPINVELVLQSTDCTAAHCGRDMRPNAKTFQSSYG